MTAIDRTDLIGPSFLHNQHRVANRDLIEFTVSTWTSQQTPDEICGVMEEARVPCGKIMNVKDIVECQHLIERGMMGSVWVEGERNEGGWEVKVPGVSLKL